MSISPARIAAFDILSRVEAERAYSSILLPIYEEGLSPRDRGLCHQLTLGVLRRQMYLDRAIDIFSGSKKLDAAVRVSLRLGLFQLWFLDKIPAHSAVHESVELVRRAKKASAKSLTNAILRRAAKGRVVMAFQNEVERLSVEFSHPEWLVERWIGQFGTEEAARLVEANNIEPTKAFRYTTRLPEPIPLAGTRASAFVPDCFLTDELTPEIRSAAERGEIYFQDEGSQLVASSVTLPVNGRFLDVCSAPGSKFTQIAASGIGKGFVAGDIHPHRIRTLRENIRQQGISNAGVLVYDAEQTLPFAEKVFDAVLVDAPCSGTGTIRHNPELRYLLKSSDLVELADKQLGILLNASKLVKDGGTLVYSTCSLERDENEAVCERFLTLSVSFRKVSPAVPDRFLTPSGYARTMPHIDETDGFFIAKFTSPGPH